MAFVDYSAEIFGTIPRIDELLARKLVNRAWEEIRDERPWSFLFGEGVFIAPQIVTAGTITTTQFSPTVQLDNTASTALNNLGNPMITTRQFRAGIGGGAVYNIQAATGLGAPGATLTLDRPFLERSLAAGSPYQVYRCYYQPSDLNGNFITDFSHFKVILNPVDGYAITGENLLLTKQEIDARDPTRGAQDLPYTVATYKVDANGYPIYEFWPHPTSQRGYVYLYQRRGIDLSTTQDLPGTFPKGVLVDKTKLLSYEWAVANAGRFPELKGVDWNLLAAQTQKRYEKKLQAAKLRDDDLFLTSFIPQLRDYLTYPPIDSRFFQSHDAGSWFDS